MSKFPEAMGLIEVLNKYFKDVVYDQPSISFDGIKRYDCIGYNISNDIYKALSNTNTMITFNFIYRHINDFGNVTYTENRNEHIYLKDILKQDVRNRDIPIFTIFDLSYDDIQHLVKLWYEFIIPTEKWEPILFEITHLPKEFIEILIDKGYFNTERYTIDELLGLSSLFNNIEIIPKDARDIFIF